MKLSQLSDTVKRFPAASVLALANTGLIGWTTTCAGRSAAHLPLACLYASGMGIVLSVCSGLVGERLGWRRSVAVAWQAAVLAFAGYLAWLFSQYGDIVEPRFCCSYYLSLAALAALMAVVLGWLQTAERVFPCAVFASVLGGAAAVAVGGGFTLVLVAVDKLFGANISDKVYGTLWGGAFATVGMLFFLSFVTRREPFEYPKAWRILLVYVVLPIYLVLLAVLWAYLGKCVVTWSLPNGQINWLVTVSASMWMGLHLVLGGIDSGFVRRFRRLCAWFVMPLVGLQIIALQIRIAEYGLTPDRYASVLFVVFVLVFAALSLVRSRWATPAAYAFFAALALFAAHSHWNVIDTGVRSQLARLEPFRARKAAGENFDKEARHAIMGIWEFVDDYTLTNGVYRYRDNNWEDRHVRFKADWGFAYETPYERRHPEEIKDRCTSVCRRLKLRDGHKIDISGYSSCVIGEIVDEGAQVKVVGVSQGNGKFITEPFIRAAEQMKDDGQLEVDVPDFGRIVAFDGCVSLCQKEGEKTWTIRTCYGKCLLLRK